MKEPKKLVETIIQSLEAKFGPACELEREAFTKELILEFEKRDDQWKNRLTMIKHVVWEMTENFNPHDSMKSG